MIFLKRSLFLTLTACVINLGSGNDVRLKRAGPEGTLSVGYVLFPTYQPLDVMGPVDILTVLSWSKPLNLSLIARSLDPVSTALRSPSMSGVNSTFSFTINPTHSFDTADDLTLDVLFVPGGIGTRATDLADAIEFVRRMAPRVKYVVSVCTGAGILARAGVLDGRNATTNKLAWNTVTALGPKTYWVGQARWVVDGNVWTTSGVAAGMDGTLAWISHVWDEDTATKVADGIEYEWHRNSSWDPFAVKNGVHDVPPRNYML